MSSCKWIPPHRRNLSKGSKTSKRRCDKDITPSEKKSQFDNHRYPNSKEYRQNWIDMESQLSHRNYKKRVKHIESILDRVKEVNDSQRKYPSFLELMYALRFEALVTAYFEEAERELYLSRYSVATNASQDDNMTEWEKHILNLFSCAVEELKKDVNTSSCKLFTEADKEFGWYRHQRWVNSF
jgi:hypothetical protein